MAAKRRIVHRLSLDPDALVRRIQSERKFPSVAAALEELVRVGAARIDALAAFRAKRRARP